MDRDLILIDDYCKNSSVEMEFIRSLEDEGLIVTQILNDVEYLDSSQLGDLETFSRLHYDLSVNVEGIDIINNLLAKMRQMERELTVLRRQFGMASFQEDEFEDFFDEF
jgi:phage terminase small subunit